MDDDEDIMDGVSMPQKHIRINVLGPEVALAREELEVAREEHGRLVKARDIPEGSVEKHWGRDESTDTPQNVGEWSGSEDRGRAGGGRVAC